MMENTSSGVGVEKIKGAEFNSRSKRRVCSDRSKYERAECMVPSNGKWYRCIWKKY